MATTSLLTAPAGTGKSYWCVYELVTQFLPDEKGPFFTNLPLGDVPETHAFPPEFEGETFVDRINEFVGEKCRAGERIEMFPPEVLSSWADGHSGPWDYFEGRNLTNAYIVIDEIHNFCGKHSSRTQKRKFQKWSGELRHQGARVLYVTQSPNKLAREIMDEAGARFALVDQEERRDPFFGIKLYYWYQLRAKLAGQYRACFARIDLRDVDGKKVRSGKPVTVARDPQFFRLYDSFNAPVAGGEAAGEAPKQPWEKHGWFGLLRWFFRHNVLNFFKPVAFCVLLFVAVTRGGDIFLWFTQSMVGSMSTQAPATAAFKQKDPVVAKPVTRLSESGTGYISSPAGENVADLRDELKTLREAKRVREEAEALAAVFRVVTPESVTLDNGVVYSVGDVVEFGLLQGKKINGIDYTSRSVWVGGDRVLLGDGWVQKWIKARVATDATVSPGTGATADEEEDREAAVGDDLGGRSAAGAVRAAVGTDGGGVGGGRRVVRVKQRKLGGDEPASGRRDSDGRASSGDASDTYGESVLRGGAASGGSGRLRDEGRADQ